MQYVFCDTRLGVVRHPLLTWF